jgi:pyruvate kinase
LDKTDNLFQLIKPSAAAAAVLDKAVMVALSAETCCLSYPVLYVACMTDFEKYI